MIELDIIKIFMYNKDNYIKYYNYLDTKYLKSNYDIIYRIFQVINIFYTKYSQKDSMSFQELESLYLINFPIAKETQREEFKSVITKLKALEDVENEVVVDLLKTHRVRAVAQEIAVSALNVAEGKDGADKLLSSIDILRQAEEATLGEVEFITDDLEILYNEQVKTPGLRWRQKCLNDSLGSLRPGDFGFVFARPETGKTTFLASEITHMATQADAPILWFNNEEQGQKVMVRLYEAALGLPAKDIFRHRPKKMKEYKDLTGGRIKIIDDLDFHTKTGVEALIDQHKPALVIFDQIDNLTGFELKNGRKDLELGEIYKWARRLARDTCPIIGICQADGSGEGVRYLTMSHVANAKTAKQETADWILGIGKSHDTGFQNVRFFNISKNKLMGDMDTLPELRHAQGEMIIEPEKDNKWQQE